MTGGFRCDIPGCNAFMTRIVGVWEHHRWNPHKERFEKELAHLCEECAAPLSETIGLFESDAEDETDAA